MCAAVRIAMTVGGSGSHPGIAKRVVSEAERGAEAAFIEFSNAIGVVQADLRIGADVGSAVTLVANATLSNRGVQLIGSGFIVKRKELRSLGIDCRNGFNKIVREYFNGKDITQRSRDVFVIDLFGMDVDLIRQQYPEIYQQVLSNVKPERDQNNRKAYRDNWWIHGEPRRGMRITLAGLRRYIVTVETSKHRFFVFLEAEVLPDNKLVCVALDDSFFLGLLSSRVHVCWSLASGSRLGVGNDPVYVKTTCFEAFPFPNASEPSKQRIRALGEQLDAQRKRQQDLHPTLTMTGMYNVLEKLRSGEALTAKEKVIHEQGLVSVLKQIHDDLDAAVFEAYGWPTTQTDEEILERLVALNHERAEEESRGIIRWLRPEFQNPENDKEVQRPLELEDNVDDEDNESDEKDISDDGDLSSESKGKRGRGKAVKRKSKSTAIADKPAKKLEWPKSLPDRIRAVRSVLESIGSPITPDDMAKRFTRAPKTDVAEILETLVAVGKARVTKEGRYAA